jgi:hypothetical protein
MIESEWQSCNDPWPMRDHVRDRLREGEVRLFACACCRRVWQWLTDPRSRKAVEIAERFAEGLATLEDLSRARTDAEAVKETTHPERDAAEAALHACGTGEPWQIAHHASWSAANVIRHQHQDEIHGCSRRSIELSRGKQAGARRVVA